MQPREWIADDVQRDLCIRAQQGDLAARDRLVAANMGTPWKIASEVHRSHRSMEVEDLAMEGAMGILRAIEKYDPARGCKFRTYAQWWVVQFIQNATYTLRGISHGVSSRLYYANQVLRLREEGVDRDEAIRRIAAKHRTHLDTMEGLVGLLERPAPVSLDASLGDWDRSMHDRVAAKQMTVEDVAIENLTRHAIDAVVARFRAGLDDRDRRILDARILADEGSAAGLTELAKEMGVCKERVRQIDMRLRTELRRFVQQAEETRELIPVDAPVARHADYDRLRSEIRGREAKRTNCRLCKRPCVAGLKICDRHRSLLKKQRLERARKQGGHPAKLRLLTYRGKTRTITEWAQKLGMPVPTLGYRLQQGWSVAKALSTPVKRAASAKEAA